MRPYGVHRKHRGCCPGHDTYPADTYSSNRSKRARARGKQSSHQLARAEEKILIREILQTESEAGTSDSL